MAEPSAHPHKPMAQKYPRQWPGTALKDRICATASSQTTPYAVRRAVAFLLLSFFLQLCFEIRCLPSTPKCTCLAKTYLTHVLYLTAVSC